MNVKQSQATLMQSTPGDLVSNSGSDLDVKVKGKVGVLSFRLE